jgi:hypothetical protein
MRNRSLIKFFHQLSLRAGAVTIEIDHYKLHSASVLFVEFHSAPRLPLGIEAAFAVKDCVSGFAGDCAIFQMIPSDQPTVLAVACVNPDVD